MSSRRRAVARPTRAKVMTGSLFLSANFSVRTSRDIGSSLVLTSGVVDLRYVTLSQRLQLEYEGLTRYVAVSSIFSAKTNLNSPVDAFAQFMSSLNVSSPSWLPSYCGIAAAILSDVVVPARVIFARGRLLPSRVNLRATAHRRCPPTCRTPLERLVGCRCPLPAVESWKHRPGCSQPRR